MAAQGYAENSVGNLPAVAEMAHGLGYKSGIPHLGCTCNVVAWYHSSIGHSCSRFVQEGGIVGCINDAVSSLKFSTKVHALKLCSSNVYLRTFSDQHFPAVVLIAGAFGTCTQHLVC